MFKSYIGPLLFISYCIFTSLAAASYSVQNDPTTRRNNGNWNFENPTQLSIVSIGRSTVKVLINIPADGEENTWCLCHFSNSTNIKGDNLNCNTRQGDIHCRSVSSSGEAALIGLQPRTVYTVCLVRERSSKKHTFLCKMLEVREILKPMVTSSSRRPHLAYRHSMTESNLDRGSNFPSVSMENDDSADVSIPPKPEGLNISDLAFDMAVLNWSSENDSKFNVSFHIVTWDNVTRLSHENFCLVDPLRPWTNYTLTVKACVNENACSEGSQITFTTFVYAPSEVLDLLAEVVDSWTASLKWKEPAEPNGPLDGYIITIRDGECDNATHPCREIATNSTAVEVDDLDQMKFYSFSVKAFNRFEGRNIWSDKVSANLTTPAAAPPKPKEFRVKSTTYSSVILVWSKNTDTRHHVSHYLVCRDSCDFEEDVISFNTTMAAIETLSPYTSYNFSLQACNGAFCSNETKVVCTTDAYYPGKPENVVAKQSSDAGSVVLSWQEPKEKNGPLDCYRITWYPTKIGSLEKNVTLVNGNITTLIISNLRLSTDYTFGVQACNFVDLSAPLWSASSIATLTTKSQAGSNLKVLLPAILVPMLLVLTIAIVAVYLIRSKHRILLFFRKSDDTEPIRWSTVTKTDATPSQDLS